MLQKNAKGGGADDMVRFLTAKLNTFSVPRGNVNMAKSYKIVLFYHYASDFNTLAIYLFDGSK